MNIFKKLRQKRIEKRFKRKGLNIIQHIPSKLIHNMLHTYVIEGWQLGREYNDSQALAVYKKCEIRRGQSTLAFTLNDDETGNIVGPQRIVRAVAERYSLEAKLSPR